MITTTTILIVYNALLLPPFRSVVDFFGPIALPCGLRSEAERPNGGQEGQKNRRSEEKGVVASLLHLFSTYWRIKVYNSKLIFKRKT